MLRVAERQQGAAHRGQVLGAGVHRGALARRVAAGEAHYRLFRDVVLVGRPHPEKLHLAFAALLHFRGDAVLSHRVAGYVWQILDELSDIIDVTLVGRNAEPQPSTRIHRVASLARDDFQIHRGFSITSVARTLVDLAGCLSPIELESALAIALRRRLTSRQQIKRAIERAPQRRGVHILRALLESDESLADTRSRYERRLLGLIRQAGLPAPETNVMWEGYLADLLWRELRIVVEMDGFGVHGTRHQFELDRQRGGRLAAANCRLIRVTAKQIDETPAAVIAWIAAAIALARAGA